MALQALVQVVDLGPSLHQFVTLPDSLILKGSHVAGDSSVVLYKAKLGAQF